MVRTRDDCLGYVCAFGEVTGEGRREEYPIDTLTSSGKGSSGLLLVWFGGMRIYEINVLNKLCDLVIG